MNDAIDAEALIRQSQERLASGAPIEGVLFYLRANGCTMIDSIIIISAATQVRRSEAKRIVHSSATWADCKVSHDQLHDLLEHAIDANDANDAN